MDGRSQKFNLWSDCRRADYIYGCGGDNDYYTDMEERMRDRKLMISFEVVCDTPLKVLKRTKEVNLFILTSPTNYEQAYFRKIKNLVVRRSK